MYGGSKQSYLFVDSHEIASNDKKNLFKTGNFALKSSYMNLIFIFCFSAINGQCTPGICQLLYNAQPACLEVGTMSFACVCTDNQNQQVHCEDIPCK